MFSHEKKKGSQRIANCLFSRWTSQGLNLGPPDYESFCVLFHRIT